MVVASIVALGAALSPGTVLAAPLTWETKGAFEVCLEGTADAWLRVQAELLVNDDPAAGQLDDQAVAGWTVQALAQCKTGAGTEVPASTERFAKYMAQWRQHIYDLAAGIRQKGGAD